MPRIAKKETIKKEEAGKFYQATGGRKTSAARVRLTAAAKAGIPVINGKSLADYFPTKELQQIVMSPLETFGGSEQFQVQVKVEGGGIHSQAEAVRHGLARALVLFNADFRKKLKKAGFLKRDPREKERKKFGLKRARKAPQWAKR